MFKIGEFIKRINTETPGGFAGEIRFDEPMAAHTSFQAGGPADVWIQPEAGIFPDYAAVLLSAARQEGIPVFILGCGANLLVSDKGIRGIVLDTGLWRGWDFSAGGDEAAVMTVRSGETADAASNAAASAVAFDASQGWSGLEFLAGMPGSLGGAVWMNARCYEKSLSDILIETEILDFSPPGPPRRLWLPREEGDFSYKKSPFQGRDALILTARLSLRRRPAALIHNEMEEHRRDREEKGHFRYPSAGSVFKNSRDFGKPTGRIIDELGLRGLCQGGAQVAPWHGNIIINTGGARASDIRGLLDTVSAKVKAETGICLEPEIIFAGEW